MAAAPQRNGAFARRFDERGQGLVEMLIALFILAVAIAALFTLMTAGALSLQRASLKGTAATLADKQLELYRTIGWDNIRLSDTAVLAVPATSTYVTAHSSDPDIPSSTGQVTDSSSEASCTPICSPVQSDVAGPDHRYYRIDTYITLLTPAPVSGVQGRDVKQVYVVVRNAAGDTILARNTSTFDQSTDATG